MPIEFFITLHIILALVAVLLMWVNVLGYRYSFTKWGTASSAARSAISASTA